MRFIGCDSGGRETSSAEAEQLLTEASKQKDFKKILLLADSLAGADVLSEGESYYWQGFAYYRMMQRHSAEFYWKESMESTEGSTNPADLAVYAKSASFLVGLYIRYFDYSSALTVVKLALDVLDRQKFDSTSDYTNLLIFAGCCQAHFGAKDSLVNSLFERAYQRHLDNIGSTHSKDAYRDAVVGVINIAYGWLSEKKYQQGQLWIERLGSLLEDYKQLFGDDEVYIDKQWARYQIFLAIALEGQGFMDEAAMAYTLYQQTNFAHSFEGQIDGSDYLSMAGHWQEAAANYQVLEEHLNKQQSGYSLEELQKFMLKKYLVNVKAGLQDSANAVANRICEHLDSAIMKSRWIDAEEQETIRQKEEQLLHQQERISRGRVLSLLAVIILLSIFFVVYTIIRHRAQKHLAAANTQLELKNQQLAIANAHAQESARMKTDFIKQMSHEIRTPLNILSGFTQIVTTPGMELDEETRQDVNRQITFSFAVGN